MFLSHVTINKQITPKGSRERQGEMILLEVDLPGPQQVSFTCKFTCPARKSRTTALMYDICDTLFKKQ